MRGNIFLLESQVSLESRLVELVREVVLDVELIPMRLRIKRHKVNLFMFRRHPFDQDRLLRSQLQVFSNYIFFILIQITVIMFKIYGIQVLFHLGLIVHLRGRISGYIITLPYYFFFQKNVSK